ncbi:hypothetical protein Rmet_6028 (plasmid) [Cupriavidus metallidurans CH34]|uniref:Uncharacterized protein n=2 Tax=Cupriavidus metallidurans TaxID=119219 RepID=Q1LAD9_CUPMC|nr:hypothetical protein Rmet_6028 [Cupriavidus metallidurans CH34]
MATEIVAMSRRRWKCESLSDGSSHMRIEFCQQGTWVALEAARAWCRENGLSVGQSCATGPSGLLFGKVDWIAKWRNLAEDERDALHGTMSGDFREGPIVIVLKDEAVAAHMAVMKAKNPPTA